MQDGPSTFEAERHRLVEDLTAVEHLLDKYSDELDDRPEAREIRQLAQAVPGESSALLKEGRLLQLGIVGQIKAGKSTLLNLLLFDGREVLPKAATPMTAALTHIVRSDELGAGQAEIEVDYYSRDEWQEIEQHADEYRKAKQEGRNPEGWLQACHELVEMAARRRGSFMDMDHTAPDIRSVPVDNLNEELHRLVGAEGDLTPWVKSVTIRCGEGVPDLDIVDTPGLNDPVISRVRETRKLLAKCDAVLLLSYAGQFMDSSDIQLLTETLPDEGIRRRVVIGSKFDSALVDEARTYRGNLLEAVDDIEKKLREIATTKSKLPDDDVVFVSAMCAVLGAKREAGRWSDAERDVFDTLRSSYPDWFDNPRDGLMNEATARNLAELVGRREHVDQRISEIRDDKDRIIRDNVLDYLGRKRKAAEDRIFALIDELKEYQDEVGTAEIEQLKDRMLAAREAIQEIRDKVIDTWSGSLNAQRKGIDETRKSFSNAISEARQNVEDSVTTESHRIKKPAGILGFSFLGRLLSGEDHYEQYERKVLNANSLKLALDEGYDKIRNIVHEQLREMFDYGFVGTVRETMRRALADSLDNEIAAIVGRSLGSSLNQAVETIAARARDKIAEHTAGSAPERFDVPERGTDSSKQSKSIEYVNELSNYCDMVLKDAEGTMDKTIENAESDLIPVAVQHIEEHYARLERDLEEREFKLQRYRQAIDELGRCGQRLAS